MGALPGRQAINQYWTLLRTLAVMFQFVLPSVASQIDEYVVMDERTSMHGSVSTNV